VKNRRGEVLFRFKAPWVSCACPCATGSVDFPILAKDGRRTDGKIVKTWGGWIKECCTDTDNMEIIFPLEVNPEMKALLIGAAMLIEFMWYETSKSPLGYIPVPNFLNPWA